jgi:hypothetical protein
MCNLAAPTTSETFTPRMAKTVLLPQVLMAMTIASTEEVFFDFGAQND